MANAILNFHFDFPHPSLNNTAGQSASCDRVLFFGQCSTLQWFYCFQSGRLILQTCGKGILPGDQSSQYAWRTLLWAWVDVNILYLSLFPYVFVFVSLSISLCVSVFEYLSLSCQELLYYLKLENILWGVAAMSKAGLGSLHIVHYKVSNVGATSYDQWRGWELV